MTARRCCAFSRPWCLGLALTALALNGCSTGIPFSVTAERLAEPAGKSYRIASGNPTVPTSDPEFVRVAGYVRAALSSKGLYEAPPGVLPGMVVEIEFTPLPPRVETLQRTEDITEWVPEQTVTRTKKSKQPDGSTITETVTEKIPAHEKKVGERIVYQDFTVYPKRFRLVARDTPEAAPGGDVRRLWVVEVANDDLRDAFDEYLPLMVAAAMDYIAANAAGPQTVLVAAGDRRVEFVLRGVDETAQR